MKGKRPCLPKETAIFDLSGHDNIDAGLCVTQDGSQETIKLCS